MATIVQSVGANSGANNTPASITLTLPQASSPLNAVVAYVYCIGSASPTITPPSAAWIQIRQNVGDTAHFDAMWILPPGNGSITSAVFTMAGTVNGVCGAMVELSDISLNAIQRSYSQGGSNASSTTFAPTVINNVAQGNDELWLVGFGWNAAQTINGTPGSAYTQIADTGASSGATLTCRVRLFMRTQVNPALSVSAAGMTTGVATNVAAILGAFSQAGTSGPAVGQYGASTPGGYSGAGGAGPG